MLQAADYARFQEPAERAPIHGNITWNAAEFEINGTVFYNVGVSMHCDDDGYEIIEIDEINIGSWSIRIDSPKGTLERVVQDEIEDAVISSGTAYAMFREATE